MSSYLSHSRVWRLLRIAVGSICRALPGRLGHGVLCRLERGIAGLTTVFDAEYYLRVNTDVAESGVDPLRHYILHGAGEGRNPSPLFDTAFYLEQVNIPDSFPFSPLAHFLLIGRHKRISPSPWFDFSYYERHHPEVMTRRMCPYLHFVQHGVWRNWQACADFDPAAYLREHPEVPEGVSALLHFLQQTETGRMERRMPSYIAAPFTTGREDQVLRGQHLVDALGRLEKVDCQPASEKTQVHVILPVYDGFDTTLRALYSALTGSNETPWTLTVINDCSPDEQLSQTLRSLAEKLPFRLIEHESNMGFVRTVNEGMQLLPGADVILLNADTEVCNDWIDRLRKAASSQENAATVTPLSNNATICSYPVFLQNNVQPLELQLAELDTLAAQVNAGMCVEAPTGVGFCMYITRKTLDAVGLFDAETFGRGYGEENDFCQRAEKQGFVNLLAADVYVRHVGGVSFGAEKRQLMKSALEAINRKHPGYDARVQAFIRRDPLRQARENLDKARLRRLRKERNVLFLGLTRGGGAELAMHRHMQRERQAGKSVFALVPTGEGSRVRIMHMDVGDFPNLPDFDLDTQVEEVAALLRELEIGLVEIHHLIELSAQAPRRMASICQRAGVAYHFHVHDYLPICPRLNLIDDSGVYCGEQGLEQCKACLKGFTFKGEVVDIELWRAGYGALLRGAAQVLAPSEDVRKQLFHHFPDVLVKAVPHEPPVRGQVRLRQREAGVPLRIAVLGAIGPPKGVNVLLELARHVRKKRLPVRLSVIGLTSMDARLQRLGVQITGAYSDDHVQELISEVDPDCFLLPSVCPETYSFALSHVLRSGRPVAAFDIGAIAERVRDLPHALLLPLELHDKPQELMERMLRWMDGLQQQLAGRQVRFEERRLPVEERSAPTDYVIFFTPRSGSSYLTSVLASTNCLGNPDEWINPQWVDKVMKGLGADTPEELVEKLKEKKASRNGIFGLEATYFHIIRNGLHESSRFREFCSNSRVFILFRRDIVRQAISLYKAVETNLFHMTDGAKAGDVRKLDEAVEYDGEKIRSWVEHIRRQEVGTMNFVKELEVKVIFLAYEDIVSVSPDHLARVFFNIMNVDATTARCQMPKPRHRKLATRKNDIFYNMFVEEYPLYIREMNEARRMITDMESFALISPECLEVRDS